jgi:hypothetical protein
LCEVEADPNYKVDLTCPELTDQERQKLRHLIEVEYPDIFSKFKYDLGEAKVPPVSIQTTTDIPVKSKYLRVPFSLKEDLRQQNEAMCRHGIMEPSKTPWVSCWVMVKKKDGSQRPCIDFRMLNSVTIPDHFPLC